MRVTIIIFVFPVVALVGCSDMLNTYVINQKTYSFQIELEWHWSSSTIRPNSVQVMCSPVVADLDNDTIPDIIFHTYEERDYRDNGTLRAVSGNGGKELFAVTDYTVLPGFNPAAGDIDNDGRPEIVTVSNTYHVIAFEHEGSFKWQSDIPVPECAIGSITLADIDEDGVPEVILGNYVWNNNGTIKWIGAGTDGAYNSYAVNLDLEGTPELIAGITAYRSNGDIYWQNNMITTRLFSAVADVDSDPYPEVVVAGSGNVYILEHDGTLKLGPIGLDSTGGGPPCMADVDNDGEPEICVSFAQIVSVLENDGTVKWSYPIEDKSSQMCSATAFDFDADGCTEVLHTDEYYFRIFNGQDGTLLYERYIESGTLEEFPLVVDVDNDKSAEIIIVSNEFFTNGIEAEKGILVFGDKNDASIATRTIWNQYFYFITNIRDNCTIPRVMQNNWSTYNNFRQNPPIKDS